LAVAAALALAVPVASVSAATNAPVARTAVVGFGPGPVLVPGLNNRPLCALLFTNLNLANASGNARLAILLDSVIGFFRCNPFGA
jgi:hypothetical protein